MKTKNLLSLMAGLFATTGSIFTQIDCHLINSLTLSVPENSIQLLGNQGYVNNVQGQDFKMPLELNKWHYVAFTKSSPRNSGVSTIYLDGKLIFTGNYMHNFYNWKKLILGHAFSDPLTGPYNIILPFKGYIDEVRISNVVRNEEEIRNTFMSNEPFLVDSMTIGLWHLDQNSGATVNGDSGQNGQADNITWSQGVFGNCAEFNGVNSSIIFNQALPSSNITCEFWIKPTSLNPSWPISFDGSFVGGYTAGFLIDTTLQKKSYTWSTGETGNSITVNPTTLPYIWVNDGNCADTIWLNSQLATIYDTTYVTETIYDTINVTFYDTLLTTVTDTLLINAQLTGINPPNNQNTLKVYPNPANTHITIDYGNFNAMSGYTLTIVNEIGQTVFTTPTNQQISYIDLSTWTGNGIYFVKLIDPQNNTIENRKIVIQ